MISQGHTDKYLRGAVLRDRAGLFLTFALYKVPECKAAAAHIPTLARYLQQALERHEMLR